MSGHADLDVLHRLRQFILETYASHPRTPTLAANDSLSGTGVVDSVGVLSLVTFLEEEFGITVADDDVVPDNMDSLAKLSAYIGRKRAGLAT